MLGNAQCASGCVTSWEMSTGMSGILNNWDGLDAAVRRLSLGPQSQSPISEACFGEHTPPPTPPDPQTLRMRKGFCPQGGQEGRGWAGKAAPLLLLNHRAVVFLFVFLLGRPQRRGKCWLPEGLILFFMGAVGGLRGWERQTFCSRKSPESGVRSETRPSCTVHHPRRSHFSPDLMFLGYKTSPQIMHLSFTEIV